MLTFEGKPTKLQGGDRIFWSKGAQKISFIRGESGSIHFNLGAHHYFNKLFVRVTPHVHLADIAVIISEVTGLSFSLRKDDEDGTVVEFRDP